jgi:GMP synthase (glutamine-hydrolysing)
MKKILIVEGNLREENQSFTDGGIKTHTESLKDSIAYFTDKIETDVVNPSSDKNISEKVVDLEKYDGLIWGGSSLNIYSDTIEIRRQIEFMRECQKKIKKILAICWGLQVAVTVAGGQVKRCTNGSHRGIALNIEINNDGLQHPIYKNKDKQKKFNTPAFNFDEVVTLPKNSKLLASNPINKVMGVNFKSEASDIWGIQYHPEITYDKMISLIHFRKDRLLNNNAFVDEQEINNHVKMIAEENKITNKDLRMRELENWLNYLLK